MRKYTFGVLGEVVLSSFLWVLYLLHFWLKELIVMNGHVETFSRSNTCYRLTFNDLLCTLSSLLAQLAPLSLPFGGSDRPLT